MSEERLKRAGEIVLVSFSQIEIDSQFNNGRQDLGNVEELADSIFESGLQIPLKVKKVRGEDRYILVHGKRRYHAIKHLVENKGVEFAGIKCILAPVDYNVENSLFDQITMNDGKPYSNLEQGIVFQQLVNRGYNVSEISKKVGKSVTHINQCIEQTNLPKEVQNMVLEGTVSGATAVNLSKVVNEAELVDKIKTAVKKKSGNEKGSKKVTAKDITEVQIQSPIKRLELLKETLKEQGIENEKTKLLFSLLSRVKAGQTVEEMIELFE